jgi:hypothetical protein
MSIWLASHLPTTLTIKSGYLSTSITVPFKADKSLNSRITVREKYASDLLTVIGIYQFSTINTSISIVQNGGNSGFVIII